MPTTRPPHWTVYAGLIVAVLGFLTAVAGMIWQGGYLANQVRGNTERLSKLETRMDSINGIDTRLARMEGKLDAAVSKDTRP